MGLFSMNGMLHYLNSSAFSFQSDKVEHRFDPVANHPSVKFIRRKCIQDEISTIVHFWFVIVYFLPPDLRPASSNASSASTMILRPI